MIGKFLGLMLLAVVAAGCGVQAQSYVMTKERTDIENISGGNAGYLKGDPKYMEPHKKTRKVYVLELNKPVPESEVKKIEEMTSTQTKEVSSSQVPAADDSYSHESPQAPAIVIPNLDDVPVSQAVKAPEEGPGEAVAYTVLKDDTLQKIAKKFYNSFGKWTKIYEANKDKLKNPNFVKPGTVITIPAVEKN